jgi:uncharacterized protein (DUF1778 family)
VTQGARIDIRTDAARKGIILRAAELTRTSVTQFILDRVIPDAEQIVSERERQRIQLDAGSWAEFCARLDAAPKDLPNLRKLLSRPSRFSDVDERS